MTKFTRRVRLDLALNRRASSSCGDRVAAELASRLRNTAQNKLREQPFGETAALPRPWWEVLSAGGG